VVTQTFQNPFTEPIEAVYVFPLPHEAAVTDLTMQVGDRTIVGEIERRETARAIYENARDAGYVAALLEQERANIFTQSVANILPGNEIEVKITYVGALEYEKGEYELVFPMVVGPRFVPPASRPTGDALAPAGGLAPIPIPSIPDADRITPPYLPPSVRSGHDVSVYVNLDAGIAVRDVRSPTHSVRVDRDGSRRASVRLRDLDDIPNKDFVLRYRVDGDGPETAVLSYHNAEDGYVSVVVQPKIDLTPGEITPKEMVFVLDCSGSMSGDPIAAAKSLVRHALREMRPQDSFQIIRFSSNASGIATVPIACTPDNVLRGVAYLDGLNGGGGTMMIEGVKAALDFPTDPNRLRIVMFLTDGYDRARGDAEDRARTVGVRAAVPLGLCLLPAFVVLGIVPLAAGLLASFA
jgi:Ca-activated chloride channel family protein